MGIMATCPLVWHMLTWQLSYCSSAGLDYEATTVRVSFPPGGPFHSRQTVSIVISDDRLRESKEDFRAELFIPESPINFGANVVLGEDSVAVVIIEDDEIGKRY